VKIQFLDRFLIGFFPSTAEAAFLFMVKYQLVLFHRFFGWFKVCNAVKGKKCSEKWADIGWSNNLEKNSVDPKQQVASRIPTLPAST